jgi:Prokaryotic phospholipase A2
MTSIHSERSKARIPRRRHMAIASMAIASMAIASTGSAGTPAVHTLTAGAPAAGTSATDTAGIEVAGAPSASAPVTEAENPDTGEVEPDSTKPLALIRHYTFQVSMPVFQKARRARVHGNILDWSSDGCSHVPSNPLGFDFLPSCERHDFGSRNYKRQKACNEHIRKEIDDNFKKDMYNYCNRFSGLESWKGVACRRVADTYYDAVRVLGNCK